MLIDTARIAIWNRNKVVVTLSITAWVISAAFHIKSLSLSPTPAGDLEFHLNLFGEQVPSR